MSRTQSIRLGDVIHVKHGFAFSGKEFSDNLNYPTLITPGNFAVGGGFQEAKPKTFSGDFPAEYELEPGDLVITMTDLSKGGDTLGLPALVPAGRRYLHNQRIGLVEVINPDRIFKPFLAYYLRTAAYRYHILGTASGSTVRHTSPSRIHSFTASLPSLTEQKAVAEVLGALDDKIAANTKLASTADQWVRAEYHLINRQSSEERIIGDLVSHRRQAIDPVSLETPTPYVGLEHIPRRLMWLDNHGSSEEVTSNKSYFHTGDILFGKLRPYFHKVVTAPTSGICSTDILVLASKEEIFSGYVLASLTHDDVIQAVTALSAGTRMPRTNWKDLSQVTIPWPGDLVATAFSESIQDIRGYVVGLMAENQTLAATRDALLPQLMSGKLRVKEAEKVLESAL